ncbi:MAG: oxidoreductase [Desulfuromonas sp.]|nr:MAG: oxidoreductase [Desulfuromonas sp.]
MNRSLAPRPATLLSSTVLAPDHRLLVFADSEQQPPLPGQFINVCVPGVGEFPVSTTGYATPNGQIETCVRKAGRVTGALFAQAEGSQLGLRGPFGNGFLLQEFRDRDALLIAGGLGMAPLRALLLALLEEPYQARSVTLLYGSRSPESLLFSEQLQSLAKQGVIRLKFSVDFAEEQPWSDAPGLCRIGLVTSLLEELPRLGEECVAAVCGPPILYSCILEQLCSAGIPANQIYATLERRMRCGLGTCCHCVTAGHFVCTEGPVFSLAQLRDMPGAVEGIP